MERAQALLTRAIVVASIIAILAEGRSFSPSLPQQSTHQGDPTWDGG